MVIRRRPSAHDSINRRRNDIASPSHARERRRVNPPPGSLLPAVGASEEDPVRFGKKLEGMTGKGAERLTDPCGRRRPWMRQPCDWIKANPVRRKRWRHPGRDHARAKGKTCAPALSERYLTNRASPRAHAPNLSHGPGKITHANSRDSRRDTHSPPAARRSAAYPLRPCST